MLAVAPARIRAALASPLASVAGLALALSAIVALSVRVDYPGWAALLPTVGAALVIAGGSGPVSAALSSPALTWIGRRSYSLYLWHWPALQFAERLAPNTAAGTAAGLGAALLCAVVAYEFVENPVRGNLALRRRPLPVLCAAAALVGVVVLSAHALRTDRTGSSGGGDIDSRIIAAREDFGRNYADKCHLGFEDVEQPPCVYGDPRGAKTVVIFGDSHAAQWFSAVEPAARRRGWRLLSWTKTSCPSFDAAIWYAPKGAPYAQCGLWYRSVMSRLTGPEKPDLVILSNLSRYSDNIGDRKTGAVLEGDAADREAEAGLKRTIAALRAAGVPVAVVRDTPEMPATFFDCLSRGGAGASCGAARAEAAPPDAPDIRAARAFGDVPVIDLTDALCGPSFCEPVAGGDVLYRDRHHITASTAARYAPAFEGVLE